LIILDTSILVFAVGAEHPQREPSRRILEAHASGRSDCTTTVEVIQEFLHVHARRRPRADAAEIARRYRQAFDPLITQPADLERALELFVRHPRLGAFDSVLAAVALNRSAEALVSPDRAYGDVDGLRWVDPAGPDLDALLA
jgi:uncharacterized protein